MPKTLYDTLYSWPKLHRALPRAQEELAQAILASGRLRLDADDASNFTRLTLPYDNINLTFSRRELAPPLLAHSRERLRALLARRYDAATTTIKLEQYMALAQSQLQKQQVVSPKTELMMARALVLCNADPVIRLLHLEGAEIFISFGHSVGDVMDVARWQQVGSNSGLQSIGGDENAVYVSCGGHPFLDKKEHRHTGDGQPALARFMIIAAQETGHNADMIRNSQGQRVGRYSAEGWQRAPSAKAGAGRMADIAQMQRLEQACRTLGLERIARWEKDLQFYRSVKVHGWRRFAAWLLSRAGWQVFKIRLKKKNMGALAMLQRSAYPAMQLRTFFGDMLFNLEPKADVYKRANPREEEAIACIEAVARVPQQAVKWGHVAVRFSTPALYKFYYGEIVLACERAIKNFPARK